MNFFYINHKGMKIDFSKPPYILQEIDFFDWEYSYENVNKKTCGYKRKTREYKCTIAVAGNKGISYSQRLKNWQDALDNLIEIFESDVIAGVNGKLYTDTGYYLECKIIASQKNKWRIKGTIVYVNISILAESLSWIQELTKQFLPQTTVNATRGLNYPFDYPFNYAPSKVGLATWEIDHYTSSHFLMRIYGPCVDPKVFINNYPYQVFTTLEAGDYLEIDTRNNTVIKYLANGTTQNCYNSRQFTPSIFEKIPPGFLTFSWPGNFGFDMTVFIERSEPKWDTSEKTYIVTESGRRMVTE